MSRVKRPRVQYMRMLRCLGANESGVMVTSLAIMMPIILGLAGLSVDIGNWYHGKRQAQAAADAAARAGVLELIRNSSESTIRQAGTEDALAFGFNQNEISVATPPTSGAFAGNAAAVEAAIQYHPTSFFSKFIFVLDVTVEARAVAQAVALDTCIWALEDHDPGLTIVGTADVALDCGIQINSDHETALEQVGSSCITATSIRVVGGASGNCLTPHPMIGAAPSVDPLAGLDPPDYDGCTYPNQVKVNKDTMLSPGVYCGGISISGNADVTFDTGIYTLKGGTFEVTGSSSLQGDEVAFYLTDDADLDISTTTISFSAPQSGDLEGILFFQDRTDLSTITNKIAGNASLQLDGALYFPTTELEFRGNSSASVPTPMIVARAIRFAGTTSLIGNGEPPQMSMLVAELVE